MKQRKRAYMNASKHRTCNSCEALTNPSVYPFTLVCELEHKIEVRNFTGRPQEKCYKPLNNEEYLRARNLVFKSSDDYDEEELTCMVKDCITREEKLSDWECGFINTCFDFTRKRIMLSKKQRDILTEIWERVT